MIAYRLHFEPGTLKALERVRSGELGKLRYFNSSFSQPVSSLNHRAKSGYWAGPLPDMGPYPINTVRNLFGAEPIEVFATGWNTSPRSSTLKTPWPITLKFPEGRIAAHLFSATTRRTSMIYRIVGRPWEHCSAARRMPCPAA